MPGDIFGIKKIEYQYLSVIASELCSFMPSAKVEKSTLLKKKPKMIKIKNKENYSRSTRTIN